jgi:PmbA protein
MLKKIIETTKNLSGVSAWEIKQTYRKSNQRYIIFEQVESQRTVERVTYLVTLYKIYNQKGQKVLGESSIIITEGDEVRERLNAGLEMASLVANPVFNLPEKGLTYDQISNTDLLAEAHPLDYLNQIQDDLFKETLNKVKISSAEIFLEQQELLLLNSNGLELESSETNLSVDFVLLSEKDGNLEGESQGIKQVRFYKDLCLPKMVQQYAQYASEMLIARLPKSGIYPVVFSGEALDTLFNFFCVQASGPAQYQRWTQLKPGESVISDLKGDSLTLISNPGLEGGTKSRAFDDNGLDLHRVEVITNNLFQKRMNNKRYADYLNEEATGNFTNIEVVTGSKSIEELLGSDPCYYLLRFSTFEPNSITGAFSGEIRTGYWVNKGEMIPIRGGSVSGEIREAFKRAFFSCESVKRSFFFGPDAVKIEGLAIAGS